MATAVATRQKRFMIVIPVWLLVAGATPGVQIRLPETDKYLFYMDYFDVQMNHRTSVSP
jgi:hypothetical protein